MIVFVTENKYYSMDYLISLEGRKMIWDKSIPCKVVANFNGWVTAISEKGQLIQDYAVYFSLSE